MALQFQSATAGFASLVAKMGLPQAKELRRGGLGRFVYGNLQRLKETDILSIHFQLGNGSVAVDFFGFAGAGVAASASPATVKW